MKLFAVSVLLCLTTFLNAQNEEKTLEDTIQFISSGIKNLQSSEYDQEIFKLNFDNCNLEIHQTPKDDPNKWNVYSFWLPNLDETKMELLQQPNDEWTLVLNSASKETNNDRDQGIQYDRDNGSGFTTQVLIYGINKKSLISIGQAVFYATQECKGLDRFKK